MPDKVGNNCDAVRRCLASACCLLVEQSTLSIAGRRLVELLNAICYRLERRRTVCSAGKLAGKEPEIRSGAAGVRRVPAERRARPVWDRGESRNAAPCPWDAPGPVYGNRRTRDPCRQVVTEPALGRREWCYYYTSYGAAQVARAVVEP